MKLDKTLAHISVDGWGAIGGCSIHEPVTMHNEESTNIISHCNLKGGR